MFLFYPPEDMIKPEGFLMFSGEPKEKIEKKRVNSWGLEHN